MAKKVHPAGQPNPAIRLSNLRPRLVTLFAEQTDQHALAAELDRLTDGLKPASFLPVLVGAFAGAPEPQRALLDKPAVAWLRDHGLLITLRDLEVRQIFTGPERDVARSWLEAGGIAPAAEVIPEPGDLFVEAYEVSDASQASLTILWHEDARRRRVRVASFLIDFEPPWEGALKDIAYFTFRDADRARTEYFASWRARGIPQRPIPATDATRQIWTALRQSQNQGIRLPADFIPIKGELVPFLLSLPTDPDVPALSPDELTLLDTSARRPEDLRRKEQRFGFQKRLADWSIVRIMGPPDDW